MKKLLLVTAFAVAVASPALAATSHHLRNTNASAPYAEAAYAADVVYAADPYTVVSDGKVLGRDPDIFIREMLVREGDQANIAGGGN